MEQQWERPLLVKRTAYLDRGLVENMKLYKCDTCIQPLTNAVPPCLMKDLKFLL